MTDPINLTQLRESVLAADAYDLTPTDTILALIETAEAARAYQHAIGTPQQLPANQRLSETLARYTTA